MLDMLVPGLGFGLNVISSLFSDSEEKMRKYESERLKKHEQAQNNAYTNIANNVDRQIGANNAMAKDMANDATSAVTGNLAARGMGRGNVGMASALSRQNMNNAITGLANANAGALQQLNQADQWKADGQIARSREEVFRFENKPNWAAKMGGLGNGLMNAYNMYGLYNERKEKSKMPTAGIGSGYNGDGTKKD